MQPIYPQSALPYAVPGRAIRSMSELAAIDTVRDVFFDANGRPNNLWWEFYNDVSLLNFRTSPNINGANPPDVLTAVGRSSTTISRYRRSPSYLSRAPARILTLGRKWFTSVADLQVVTGKEGQLNAFAFTIRALRIIITVHEGKTTV